MLFFAQSGQEDGLLHHNLLNHHHQSPPCHHHHPNQHQSAQVARCAPPPVTSLTWLLPLLGLPCQTEGEQGEQGGGPHPLWNVVQCRVVQWRH